jgi:hypothetical protein
MTHSDDATGHVRGAMARTGRFTRGGRRARADVAATLSWLGELRAQSESVVEEEARSVEDAAVTQPT